MNKLQGARVSWLPQDAAAKYGDVRLKALCYAILAPSPHNTQPWKLKLDGENGILVFIDPKRTLPMCDPTARQAYMGSGAFLEVLSIAATALGRRADITLFPHGQDAIEKTGVSPVARVELGKPADSSDDLFAQVPLRTTNRRPYKNEAPSLAEIARFATLFQGGGCQLAIITDRVRLDAAAVILTRAMRIETFLARTYRETMQYFRFNDEEVLKYRDGFNYENMGITGLGKQVLELTSGRKSSNGGFFKNSTVASFRKMAENTAALGLISSTENDRAAQVAVGCRYARLQLTATGMGISLQPMTQVTEEYPEMAGAGQEFRQMFSNVSGHLQLVVRMGRAAPLPHSARRRLEDMLC